GVSRGRCSWLPPTRSRSFASAFSLKTAVEGACRPPARGRRADRMRGATVPLKKLTVAAEADVFQQRGRHRGHLLAVGRLGDRDAGLVERGFGADRLGADVVEQFADQRGMLAGGILDHL